MLDEERAYLIEEACGVFGICGHQDAAKLSYLGLHALQHRGQESAGIATLDRGKLLVERRLGRVAEVFSDDVLTNLPGDIAVGHVRYSTSGESTLQNAQPITLTTKFGPMALAHNGNLTNADELREKLKQLGSIFATGTDTEVIAHLIAKSESKDMVGAFVDALKQVKGAFSLVVLTQGFMISLRDANGVRPLSIGKLGDSRLVASEPVSFNLIDGVFERELQPGEMLINYADGREESSFPLPKAKPCACIFELVYFSRPDSTIFGRSVYNVRKNMGARLATEANVDADIVVPVPASSFPAALGFSQKANLPLEMGLVRSHYVGRTFIEPSSEIRNFGVKLKLSPVKEVLEGKRVILIDDSIVRGTTSKKIVSLVRDAGAREVHFRVASPPTTNPCFYGIDTPEKGQLIASNSTLEEIRQYIDADSLAYLSSDGLFAAVDGSEDTFCAACFTGNYQV